MFSSVCFFVKNNFGKKLLVTKIKEFDTNLFKKKYYDSAVKVLCQNIIFEIFTYQRDLCNIFMSGCQKTSKTDVFKMLLHLSNRPYKFQLTYLL